jgi:hypothetical protein
MWNYFSKKEEQKGKEKYKEKILVDSQPTKINQLRGNLEKERS